MKDHVLASTFVTDVYSAVHVECVTLKYPKKNRIEELKEETTQETRVHLPYNISDSDAEERKKEERNTTRTMK